MPNINAENLEGGTANFNYDRVPDECPICHTAVYPKTLRAVYGTQFLQILFQCTRAACAKAFVGSYGFSEGTGFSLTKVSPQEPVKSVFNETVLKVSPNFVEIYNQAAAAEAYGLHQIAGIGLRKALEFLIKDFAVNQKPADASVILGSTLGQCIDNYVDDANVRTW